VAYCRQNPKALEKLAVVRFVHVIFACADSNRGIARISRKTCSAAFAMALATSGLVKVLRWQKIKTY
jgi:hypothetical protein